MFQLTLSLDDKDPLLGLKLAAARARGLGRTVVFPLRMAGLPNSMVQFAAFVEAQPEEPEEVEQLAQYLLDRVRGPLYDACRLRTAGPPRTAQRH